jgi:putative FmdB family regulatory protein
MPFYEYECSHCKFYSEVLQKVSDPPLRKCPSCGKSGFKRLISAPVFRLKGSGWYETDFKSDKDKKRNLAGADTEPAKADAKTEAKPEAKTETKAEAKTEAKPESKPAAKPAAEKASRSASKTRARPAPARKKKR